MKQTISETLLSLGSYKSPNKKAHYLKRKFATLIFLTKIAKMIWGSFRLAKKGKYSSAAFCNSGHITIAALESVNVKFAIEDAHLLHDLKSPCVFVANHMSTLETFILPAIILPFQKITFIIKKSLLNFPLFKHVLSTIDPIAIGQKKPRDDLKTVLQESVKKLQQGTSVIVFPQGNRSKLLNPKEFNSIGVKIAKKAGVPIVPIALQTDAWAPGRFLKDIGRVNPNKIVHVHFGAPMHITGNGKQEHATTIEFIENKLASWDLNN